MEGIDVEICRGCKGIWLEEGMAAFLNDLKEDIPDLEKALKKARETVRKCPRCDRRMDEIDFVGDQPTLDRCPSCGGIFLDKGEQKRMREVADKIRNPKSGFLRMLRRAVPGEKPRPDDLRPIDLG